MQIRALNPHTKVFIMPVLPTRNPAMNQNIVSFNRKVAMWLKKENDIYISHPSVKEFLDRAELLDRRWTRDGDSIHLGAPGLSKFVTIIKNSIYFREKLIKDIKPRNQRKPPKSGSPGSGKPG